MATLYNGVEYAFRIDQVTYIAKEKTASGKPIISYFLKGIAIKFSITYESEEDRDKDYKMILDEMAKV